MPATPTTDQVEARYDGQPVTNGELDSTDASNLIDEAVRMVNDIFSDRVLFTPEMRGNEDDAVIWLSCHKWAVALGEIQSEGQAGSNVTYNVPQPTERSLKRTKYGLEFLEYLAESPNIGVITT